jgi:hypothetical protein
MEGTSGQFVDGILLDGVRLDNGATLHYTGVLENYEVVEPDGVLPMTVKRASDGGLFLGWSARVEKDSVVSIYRNPEYVTVKASALIPKGYAFLVGNGLGGVKVAASGAANWCHVVASTATSCTFALLGARHA